MHVLLLLTERKHQFEKKAKLLKQYAKTLESEEGQHKASVGPAKLYEQVLRVCCGGLAGLPFVTSPPSRGRLRLWHHVGSGVQRQQELAPSLNRECTQNECSLVMTTVVANPAPASMFAATQAQASHRWL